MSLQSKRICGEVELLFDLGQDGKPTNIRTVYTSHERFETAAKNALMKSTAKTPIDNLDDYKDIEYQTKFELLGGCRLSEKETIAGLRSDRPADYLEQTDCLKVETATGSMRSEGSSGTFTERIKLRNTCSYTVTAAGCFEVALNEKKRIQKCKKNLVLKPGKSKAIGSFARSARNDYTPRELIDAGYRVLTTRGMDYRYTNFACYKLSGKKELKELGFDVDADIDIKEDDNTGTKQVVGECRLVR